MSLRLFRRGLPLSRGRQGNSRRLRGLSMLYTRGPRHWKRQVFKEASPHNLDISCRPPSSPQSLRKLHTAPAPPIRQPAPAPADASSSHAWRQHCHQGGALGSISEAHWNSLGVLVELTQVDAEQRCVDVLTEHLLAQCDRRTCMVQTTSRSIHPRWPSPWTKGKHRGGENTRSPRSQGQTRGS